MDYNNNNQKEKAGNLSLLIKILLNSEINDKQLSYKDIKIREFTICGFIYNYNESPTKVIVNIWDGTGSIEVSFFNSSENQKGLGLYNFHYKGQLFPVRLFAKIGITHNDNSKVYYNGIKLSNITFNEYVMHKIDVVNQWTRLIYGKEDCVSTKKEGDDLKEGGMKGNSMKETIKDAIERINKEKGECKFDDIIKKLNKDKGIVKQEVDLLLKESVVFFDNGNYYMI